MGKAYKRFVADTAAQMVIDELLKEHKYSLQRASELSGGQLNSSRLHDLRHGSSTPMKLSEAFIFADIFSLTIEDLLLMIDNKVAELVENNNTN